MADKYREVELTKEEAATISACYMALQNADMTVSTARAELEKAQMRANNIKTRYKASLDKLAGNICQKHEIKEVPIDQWDLSGLNLVEFEGKAKIPINEEH